MFTENIHYQRDFENAVLGACLLEKSAISRIYEILAPESFHFFANQMCYEVLREMFEKGLPIDMLTVADRLIKFKPEINKYTANPYYYCSQITSYVVSSAHVEYHAHVIQEMYIQRELMKITSSGVFSNNVAEEIARLNSQLLKLNATSQQSDWQDMSELMVGLYQNQQSLSNKDGISLTTGIIQLDKENGGFSNGNMIVLGARPSVGKSALMGQMAISMAKQDKKVGIISLEMSNNEIAGRLASIDTNCDFKAIYRGLYKDEDEAQEIYRKVGNSASRLPIYVSDKTDANMNAIRMKALKLKSRFGLDCLMIDYLQLVPTGVNRSNKSRENEVSEISRGCKLLAKELNVPLIVLSQLNRDVAKRTGKNRYPQLWDLRESGSLEQDADVVMFLHRDWLSGELKNENNESTEHEADLLVRKWRNGTLCNIKLGFDGPKMKFAEKRGLIKTAPVQQVEETEIF